MIYILFYLLSNNAKAAKPLFLRWKCTKTYMKQSKIQNLFLGAPWRERATPPCTHPSMAWTIVRPTEIALLNSKSWIRPWYGWELWISISTARTIAKLMTYQVTSFVVQRSASSLNTAVYGRLIFTYISYIKSVSVLSTSDEMCRRVICCSPYRSRSVC